MASNSIAEYLKKLGKSVKYAATEALSDQMPVASKFAVTAKDTVKDTYKYLVDSRIVNNRFGSIKNNTIYKQVNQGLSNLKADITSGQFYNPEREDIGSMMEMIMGALGDDSEIFASDLEEISAPEHDKEAAANDASLDEALKAKKEAEEALAEAKRLREEAEALKKSAENTEED